MKKNSIALMIVPIFALTACDDTTNYESVATPQNEAIVKNEEGFYSTVVLDSYASVVEQFLKDPSGNNTKSVLLNAKQYTDYFLYESNLEETRI